MSYGFKVRLYHLGRFTGEVVWHQYCVPMDLAAEIEWLKDLHKSLQHPMVIHPEYDCLESPISGARFYISGEGLLANEVVQLSDQSDKVIQ